MHRQFSRHSRLRQFRLAALVRIARPFALTVLAVLALAGCGGSSYPESLALSASPSEINGGAQYTFTATTTNATSQSGATWTLALNTPSSSTDTSTPCTDQCGSITNAGTAISSQTTSGSTTYYNTVTSMTYTAPLLPPTPNEILLTAAAASNANITEDVQFSIGAPTIVVRLSNTFSSIAPGATPVTLNATVQFDTTNSGVSWALTAAGAACSPACGTLAAQGSPSFSAIYTPPSTVPASPNNMPTITATSVANTKISAFDAFTIQQPPPPISVTITNPFSSIAAGSTGVTINATVTNDIQSQGVTWTISPTANTGALTAATALSVLYTPPNSAPQPPYNTPTITATSVAEPSQSASFTFTIVAPAAADTSACQSAGSYAFQLSGADSNGKPIAAAGVMSIDAGKVMVTSVDVNDNLQIASGGNIPGTCTDGVINLVSTRGDGAGHEIKLGEKNIHTALISLDAPLPLAPSLLGFQMQFEDVGQASSSQILTKEGPVRATIADSFDGNGRPIRGQALRQDTAAFAHFGGDFVFHLTESANLENLSASVGRFTLSFEGAHGAISEGAMDASMRGAYATPPNGGAALAGTATPPDANGRGTMNLNFAGQPSRAFVYYAASANEFVLAEMDPSACSPGSGGFNSGSISVAGFIPTTRCPVAAFSPLVAAGGADGQSLALLPHSGARIAQVTGAQYSAYDPSTGRYAYSCADADGEVHHFVIYLTAPDAFWRLSISDTDLSFSAWSSAP